MIASRRLYYVGPNCIKHLCIGSAVNTVAKKLPGRAYVSHQLIGGSHCAYTLIFLRTSLSWISGYNCIRLTVLTDTVLILLFLAPCLGQLVRFLADRSSV